MIETNDLSKQFNNNFWAVDGVSLTVQPGQILALLGQNGAGKTTTVRMLTSLLAPTRGWASVAGYDVVKHPQRGPFQCRRPDGAAWSVHAHVRGGISRFLWKGLWP